METNLPIPATMTAVVLRVQNCALVVCDCATSQRILVHTPRARCFRACDRVCITYSGAMTMSLPPQITAVCVEKLPACGC